jgi:hypothetical protein
MFYLKLTLLTFLLSSWVPLVFPAPPTTVFWLHIQKTSSWMGNFLLFWGCASLREKDSGVIPHAAMYGSIAKKLDSIQCEVNFDVGQFQFGYHVPHQPKVNVSAITLLRNPASRTISSYLHGTGIHQIMFPVGFPNRAKVKYSLRNKINASPFPILTYANLTGIKSCQTKMILGIDCGVEIILTTSDLQEALRRLRYDMFFIGLTEEAAASANLFLAMYPSQIQRQHQAQLLKGIDFPVDNTGAQQKDLTSSGIVDVTRNEMKLLIPDLLNLAPRKNPAHTQKVDVELKNVLTKHDWEDKFDSVVYKEGAKIFYERCMQYSIQTAHSFDFLKKE